MAFQTPTASSVAASGGIGGAAMTVLTWLLAYAHVVVPQNVEAAGFVLLTWAIGHYLHKLPDDDSSAPTPVAVAPVTPEVK